MRKTRFFILLLLAFYSSLLNAQGLIESITQNVLEDLIEDATGISDLKSSLWGSFLDSEAQSSVLSKAKSLSNFPIDKSPLTKIDSKYGLYSYDGLYTNVYPTLRSHVDRCFNSTHNIRLSMLGNGNVANSLKNEYDSIENLRDTESLPSLLNKRAMDSLCLFNFGEKFNDDLLSVINKNKAVAGIINNHPETLVTYKKFGESWLREDAAQLYYWSCTLDDFVKIFPKKISDKMINSDDLSFKVINGETCVMRDDVLICKIDKEKIQCNSIDVLNVAPIPNSVYEFGNTLFETDNMGRVVKVTQSIMLDSKGKCSTKTAVNTKKLSFLKSSEKCSLLFSPALLDYGAPDCYMNLLYFEKSDNNKGAIKQLKRQLKEIKKRGVRLAKLVSTIEYKDETNICSKMILALDDNSPCILVN